MRVSDVPLVSCGVLLGQDDRRNGISYKRLQRIFHPNILCVAVASSAMDLTHACQCQGTLFISFYSLYKQRYAK